MSDLQDAVYDMLMQFAAVYDRGQRPNADQVAAYLRLLQDNDVPARDVPALTDAVMSVSKSSPKPATVLEVWQMRKREMSPRPARGAWTHLTHLLGKVLPSKDGEPVYCYSCLQRGLRQPLYVVAFTLLDGLPACVLECQYPVNTQWTCGYRSVYPQEVSIPIQSLD
ncbi:MAG: hypothetical protein KIT45_06730 [Fimbriimonadia bacterium]|nr:hypothetical protein [Fimbriimonadia bacterium]